MGIITQLCSLEVQTSKSSIYPDLQKVLENNYKAQAMEDHIENQKQVLQLLKDILTLAQNRMKQQENQHHIERCFDVGDWVFLWLQKPSSATSLNCFG